MEIGYPANSLAAAIKADDLSLFQQKSQDREFNVNQEIKLHSYENFIFPDVNPTLVEFAAYYGSEQIFRHLAKSGAEFRAPRDFGFIHFAIAGGHPHFARLLEQKGCSYKGTLVTAAQFHQYDQFATLYSHKDKSVTPELLFQSAAANNVDAVLFCLDHWLPAGQLNDDGETALHYAARYGSFEVAKLLAPLVDVNLGDRTPLDNAAFRGHSNIVDLLLSHPAPSVNRQIDCVPFPLFRPPSTKPRAPVT
jgi:ankyrin repeat protein